MNATDAFQQVIEQAVEAGVRKALNLSEATNRRLLSIEEGAIYLGLSKHEIYNMIGVGQLLSVSHGHTNLLWQENSNAPK